MNIMPYLNILVFVLIAIGSYFLGRIDEKRKWMNKYSQEWKDLLRTWDRKLMKGLEEEGETK